MMIPLGAFVPQGQDRLVLARDDITQILVVRFFWRAKSMQHRYRFFYLLLCLAFFSHLALAQFGASLSGTVEDNTGAVLSGATVTLTNPEVQSVQTATTGASGFYRFSELPPGTYTVTVSAANFKSQTTTGVGVSAESPRVLDVKLQLGGTTQTVTVNGSSLPILQTGDATISSTISCSGRDTTADFWTRSV